MNNSEYKPDIRFIEFLEKVCKEVEQWPEWKKELIEKKARSNQAF